MKIEHITTTILELDWNETEQLAETINHVLGHLDEKPDDFGWSTDHRIFLEHLASKLLVNQG